VTGLTADLPQDDEWADLSDEPVADCYWYETQQHYSQIAPRRWEYESDVTKKVPDGEMLAMLNLGLEAFELPQALPVPPVGLPGTRVTVDEKAMLLIREGARYLAAYLAGERKTLVNIHSRVSAALRKEHERGYYQAVDERIKTDIEFSEQQRANVAASLVYFIRSGDGPIKIGIAQDVEKRRRSLQTAHPAPLVTLATTDGGFQKERAYHRKFAKHRLEGEWFAPHADILAEIERLNP